MIPSKTLMAVCMAAVLAAGCKKQQDAAATPETDTAAASSQIGQGPSAEPVAEAAPAPTEPVQPQAAAIKAFDINAIAVSDKPLGEWPYIAAPAGYAFSEEIADGTKDLARVPFWTGGQLVWVEGKTYQTRLHAGDGKTYSRFEVLKGIDQALTALGAVKLADKTFDEAAYNSAEAELSPFRQEFDAVQNAYWYGNSASTYVIHRADKAIWAVVTSSNDNAGLLIAEGPLPAQ